jgi:hypothetical protein
MALPDKIKQALGTPVIWGQTGATGISLTVTNSLSLDALANDAGRMGAAVDLGALWDRWHLIQLIIETGTAPTAGNVVELYLAWSHNNTTWPGKVTGSDAAYPATVANNKKQLGNPASILVATADGTTVLYQQPEIIRAKARYVTPVVVNLLGQAVRDETTATDNDSRVVLTPIITSIED